MLHEKYEMLIKITNSTFFNLQASLHEVYTMLAV